MNRTNSRELQYLHHRQSNKNLKSSDKGQQVNLFDVIEELVDDKGLDREVLSSIVCEGILAAYLKKYPELEGSLKVEHDKKLQEPVVLVQKEVVAVAQDVEDDNRQVSLKKIRFVDKALNVGDKVWVPFEGKIGRIEVLRARQVIASQIRHIEAAVVYDQFKDKEGSIICGTVHKCERGGVVVKVDDMLAFLPKSLNVPGYTCIVGHPIRALLKEVLPDPRNDNQLVLDRSSESFLQSLFELEIPEIFEKLIEIKKIARIPGYKSKVIVLSNDVNIDPVGTCVGVGGGRIKPILRELGTEKIDVIAWSSSPETLVKNALKPADIDRVEINAESGVAQVWLADDQRSLAIGKMGQNIILASRLVGMEIQLMNKSEESGPLGAEAQLGVDVDPSVF